MEVKKVMIKKFNSGQLRGFAMVNISDGTDTLTIDGIKIMEKKTGGEFFVGFPSTKFKNKDNEESWKDIVFPVNSDLREKIQDAVLKQYNKTDSTPIREEKSDLPF